MYIGTSCMLEMEGQKWTKNRSPEPGVSDSWAAAQHVRGQCPTALEGRLATAHRDPRQRRQVCPPRGRGKQPSLVARPQENPGGYTFRDAVLEAKPGPYAYHRVETQPYGRAHETLSAVRPVCLLLSSSFGEGITSKGGSSACVLTSHDTVQFRC